jgi:hypothetical protein
MKRRTMTLDLAPDNEEPPSLGDVVTTARAAYEVVDVRPVESRVWSNRWRLELGRLPSGSNDDPPLPRRGGARTHSTSTYAKGETPAQFFGVDR